MRFFAPPLCRRSSNHTGPLYHFNRAENDFSDEYTGDFFLNSSMYILNNTLLSVIGEDYDGEVNRFFLVSDCGALIVLIRVLTAVCALLL